MSSSQHGWLRRGLTLLMSLVLALAASAPVMGNPTMTTTSPSNPPPGLATRTYLPRTGQDVVAFGFRTTASGEDIRLSTILINSTGTVGYDQYVDSLSLWHIPTGITQFDPARKDEYVLLDTVPFGEAVSGRFLLSFGSDPDFIIPEGQTRGFVVVADLQDAPHSVIGETFGLSVWTYAGTGATSGQSAQHTAPQLGMSTRAIAGPTGTISYGNGYSLNSVAQTCEADFTAGAVAFRVQATLTEGLVWQSLDVSGTSWNGLEGLQEGVGNVFLFRDGTNRELDAGDWILSDINAGSFTFDGVSDTTTIVMDPDLARAPEGMVPLRQTVSFVMGAQVYAAPPESGEQATYSFSLPPEGFVLVGADSGDPAVLKNTEPPRFRELRPGRNEVWLSNAQTPTADPRVGLNNHAVAGLGFYLQRAGIETARLVDMTARITLSGTSASLEDVIAPEFQLVSRTTGLSSMTTLLASGLVDLQNGIVHVTAEDVVAGPEWPVPGSGSRTELLIHILPDAPAGATFQVQLDDADAIRFEATCFAAEPDVDMGLSRVVAEFPFAGQAITVEPHTVQVTVHEPPVGGVESYPFNAGSLEGTPQLISRFRISSRTDDLLTLRGFKVAFDAETLPFHPDHFLVHVDESNQGSWGWGTPTWVWNEQEELLEIGIADLTRREFDVRVYATPISTAADLLGESVAVSVPIDGIAIDDWVTCGAIGFFEVRDIVDREAYRPGLPFEAPPAVITSGPAQLLQSSVVKTAHAPGTNDVVAARLKIEPNAAEDHTLERLTVGLIGADFLQGGGIEGSAVRLVRDADGTGTVSAADSLLATALAPATEGTVTFEYIDALVPRNQVTRLLVVFDIDDEAETGWEFRVRLQGPGSATLRGVDSDTIDATLIGTGYSLEHTVAFPTLQLVRPLGNGSSAYPPKAILPGGRPAVVVYFALNRLNEPLEVHSLEFGLEGTALDLLTGGQFRILPSQAGYVEDDVPGLETEMELLADNQLLVAHFDPPLNVPNVSTGGEYFLWWLPDPETPLGVTLMARLPGYEPGTQDLRAGGTVFGAETSIPAVIELPRFWDNGFPGITSGPYETQQGRLNLAHLDSLPALSSRTITYPHALSPVELWAFSMDATLEPHQLVTFAFEVNHLDGDLSNILDAATFRIYRQFNHQQYHVLDASDLLLGEGEYNGETGRIEFVFDEGTDPYLVSITSTGGHLGSSVLVVGDFPFLGSGQKSFRITMPSDDLLQATGTISGLPSPVTRRPKSGDTDPAVLYSPNHIILGAPVMDDVDAWAVY